MTELHVAALDSFWQAAPPPRLTERGVVCLGLLAFWVLVLSVSFL